MDLTQDLHGRDRSILDRMPGQAQSAARLMPPHGLVWHALTGMSQQSASIPWDCQVRRLLRLRMLLASQHDRPPSAGLLHL